jgi:TRAP-type C4-dicarboxylate transport system permease small subunit
MSAKTSLAAASETLYGVARFVACAAPTAMIALTFVDVLGRQFLSAVPGASEIISMLLGLSFYAGMSLVTRERAHIVVGLAVGRYPPLWRAVETVITRIVSALAMALIAWFVLSNARKLLASQSLTEYLSFKVGYLVYCMGALTVIAALWAVVGQQTDSGRGRGAAP